MAAVQLDLTLGLEAFQAKLAAAEGMLLRLKSKTDSGVSLKTFLDTSTLSAQLAAAQKVLSSGNTSIKIGTDFYKSGSQYAISATKLKRQVIDPIQQTIAGNRNYTIKIGTELSFDQSSLKQIDQVVAKAKASLAAVQRSTAATRQSLTQLTQTPAQGGLDAAALRKLQSAAGQAGIKTSATGATELRKELRSAFASAGDDAIEGLAKGLVAKSSAVIDASTQTGQALIKALKKSLGIASPSRETAKLGQASADGFGQGFARGMVGWERQMAQAIRQAIANAWRDGLQRDSAARGALANMGRDAGAVISSSLGKALKDGLASSVAPAIRGALVGGTGGAATGGLIGGLGAAGGAIKQAVMPAVTQFGHGSATQKLGMLGHGAASLAGGGASDAFNTFLQQSVDAVVNAAMSTGGQGALLGAAGVAGVAGMAGLAKGASGSLVSQAVQSIKNRILGAAVQEAQAQAQIPGSQAGAVSAPVENASNAMGGLKTAVSTVAKGLLDFAKELSPGKLQQRIIDIAWNIDQAAEQFGVVKKDAQVLAGKIRNTWNAFSNTLPSHLLPPQPVPGTGLVRQQNLQLGQVVGRSGFDFQRPAFGVPGGHIGPAEIDAGRGYVDQTRHTLQAIAGRPGEWKIVEEANGIWQRIKSDSELAAERLAIVNRNITQAANGAQNASYRTWTDREGVGTFNPFDRAFYRPTQPPQAPPPGGGGSFGGNRFGTPSPGGALALRNVPVELFSSFKDAERLLALVEQRLAAVAKAFDTLKVKSRIQVDQEVRKLAVSLRAAELAFQKGEISASDLRAASYGAAREMAGLGSKSAEVQNLAQAFENLGIQSRAAVEALQDQRNLDLGFIESTLGRGSSEATRARNARDIQQLSRANELVRTAQGASGFGGFRGREIGNDTLNQAQQRSVLANAVREMREYQDALKLTETNAKTYQRVQAALTAEISNAERAFAVLNGTASDGERITHLARNAWGTILDDFQNLVPQLLVFAVAYNLILQRVLTTPGAVLQAAAAFDRLETSISAYLSATRGIGDASGVIAELKQVALDLGIGFEKAASSYLRFAAATQGTALEGQEVGITRTLATAGRNQGLNGEQIDRASVALTQILSKGRVQSEELRGQLAEQLPGALQVAARAFGVTTKELYRMVEAGQIAGDEFVGRFMRQLQAEGASTNQLAGSFSNVSEQLGSSIQTLAATAGQPLLAPLTVGLQALNAVIQALIPMAPVVTGLFVVLGAQALRSALGVKSLTAEVLGLARGLVSAKNPAEGYTAGLVKLTGVARVAATVLATVGKAALIGLAFEAAAGVIRYLKGEVGALGDELKKVNKIAEGGQGQGLNGLQKLLGNFNLAQNFSDRTTFFDAAKIGQSSDRATSKILANQKRIGGAIKEIGRLDRELYAERIRRDQAEANKDEQGVKKSIERIKQLEKQRGEVAFAFSPEDAQIQLGALKAAEQAMQKLIERQRSLGNNPFVEERQLERLRKTREQFEAAAKAAGLLNQGLLKIQSLGALQSRLKANEEILPTLDVNGESYRAQQLDVAGLRQAITDQQLLPQERSLKTQESVLRRMSVELKLQESVQRLKLGLVENERKVLEAALNLEQTRGRLREAVAQRRVEVANTLGAPEEALAAEVQLRRVREGNQAKELRMQSQILSKDRERIGLETNLQKEQIKLQTQQLAIDKQMLAIERLKMEAAAKQWGISADLRRSYYLQLGQIDKTIKATETLIGQEGELLQSVEQKGAAELSALGIKQQELDVQQQILGANRLTAEQVDQIKAAQQDIANKHAAALASIEAAKEALQSQQQAIESQLDVVRATVEAERERARLAEDNARAEMGLVDRLLELQQGRNDGGFFERLAKASLLGASGEQEAYDLAARRMELQRQVQEQQLRQKRLELNLKRQELEAEKALNELKLKGLRITNEEAKASLRKKLEEARLTLVTLGDRATPAQKQLLSQVTSTQVALGGYNAPGAGNSEDVNAFSLVRQGQAVVQQDQLLTAMEANQSRVYGERSAALEGLIAGEERMLGIQQRLFELDAAQWFGQFLDKTTQLGRTLGVITTGLSEFRSTVSQAFSDAITNGASAADAIADAGQALAGKVVAGLVDEMILKPMEAQFFQGLAQLFGFEKPQSEQAATASNTAQTKQAVDGVNTSVQALQGTIRDASTAVVAAINGIAKPTMATPTYRAPSNPGLTGAAGVVSRAIGGVANMLPGTRGGPNINEGVGWSAWRGRNHNGQDLGLDVGDPIHARRAGRVMQAYPSGFGKVGGAVVLRYDDGSEGTYGHTLPSVRVGDAVAAGQRIATVAPDGQNTHLHYELRNGLGKLLDPLNAIRESLRVAAGAVAPASPAPAPVALPPAQMSPLPMAQQVDAVMGRNGQPVPVTVVPAAGAVNAAPPATPLAALSPQTAEVWRQFGDSLEQAQTSSQVAAGAFEGVAASLGSMDASLWGTAGKLEQLGSAATTTPGLFQQLNGTIAGVMQLMGGIGLGYAGMQQMKGGGTYNTLMGLAGIFGMVSSVAGSIGGIGKLFGGGGSAAAMNATANNLQGSGALASPIAGWNLGMRADGGPVQARRPYVVGEEGMELFVPNTAGTIISNDRVRAAVAADSEGSPYAASSGYLEQMSGRTSLPKLSNEPIRIDSRVINGVEYVTLDQLQEATQRAEVRGAERGRALALGSMQYSVKTRKRLGLG